MAIRIPREQQPGYFGQLTNLSDDIRQKIIYISNTLPENHMEQTQNALQLTALKIPDYVLYTVVTMYGGISGARFAAQRIMVQIGTNQALHREAYRIANGFGRALYNDPVNTLQTLATNIQSTAFAIPSYVGQRLKAFSDRCHERPIEVAVEAMSTYAMHCAIQHAVGKIGEYFVSNEVESLALPQAESIATAQPDIPSSQTQGNIPQQPTPPLNDEESIWKMVTAQQPTGAKLITDSIEGVQKTTDGFLPGSPMTLMTKLQNSNAFGNLPNTLQFQLNTHIQKARDNLKYMMSAWVKSENWKKYRDRYNSEMEEVKRLIRGDVFNEAKATFNIDLENYTAAINELGQAPITNLIQPEVNEIIAQPTTQSLIRLRGRLRRIIVPVVTTTVSVTQDNRVPQDNRAPQENPEAPALVVIS